MFEYVKVTKLEVANQRRIQQLEENERLDKTHSGQTVEIAKVDGISVHSETKRFLERLRVQYRGCKFLVDKHCKSSFLSGMLVFNDVWLTMPGQAYALARVGYGNYSPTNAGVSMFMVYSRTIENEKYKIGSEQYYMAMSSDIERAVKNAKKHVRMFSPVEFAQMTAREFTNEIGRCNEEVQEKWSSARRRARESEHLYKELKHLMESGHRFLSDEFTGMVASWIENAKVWEAEQKRPIPAYFVHVTVVRDEQLFDILEITDAKGQLGNYSMSWADAKSQRFRASDIPEDIMGKLSVLSLLEPGSYSAGVGKRVDEAMFWVERT